MFKNISERHEEVIELITEDIDDIEFLGSIKIIQEPNLVEICRTLNINYIQRGISGDTSFEEGLHKLLVADSKKGSKKQKKKGSKKRRKGLKKRIKTFVSKQGLQTSNFSVFAQLPDESAKGNSQPIKKYNLLHSQSSVNYSSNQNTPNNPEIQRKRFETPEQYNPHKSPKYGMMTDPYFSKRKELTSGNNTIDENYSCNEASDVDTNTIQMIYEENSQLVPRSKKQLKKQNSTNLEVSENKKFGGRNSFSKHLAFKSPQLYSSSFRSITLQGQKKFSNHSEEQSSNDVDSTSNLNISMRHKNLRDNLGIIDVSYLLKYIVGPLNESIEMFNMSLDMKVENEASNESSIQIQQNI